MESFKAKIHIDGTYYDAEERILILFVILTFTGDKRILTISADEWPLGDGRVVPLPDQYMYKWAETLKGKTIMWELHSDPGLAAASEQTAKQIAERVGGHMEDLTNIFSSDDRTYPGQI